MLVLAFLAALSVEAATAALDDGLGTSSVLAGDPALYELRWDLIADGYLPYVDFVFEHLPLTIVPMAVAGALRDLAAVEYTVAYALVAAAMVTATAWVVSRIGAALDDDVAVTRFIALVAPLLPLVLFRNDILPVLCAALALWAAMAGRNGWAVTSAAAGVLAKGWPIVHAIVDWWRGARARAMVLAVFSIAALALMLSLPGFQSGRSFDGVHQETVAGSLVTVWRHLSGDDLGIIGRAGAVYVDVGLWAVAVNLAIGGGLAAWALLGLRFEFTWHRACLVLAALVLALLLASPLLSAQFLVWPSAFLAVSARKRSIVIAAVASLLTVALFGFWDRDAAWWAVTLVVRNGVLLVLAATVVAAAASGREQVA